MSLKGLFINNSKAQDSIYESGIMVYNCLRLSDKYRIDYAEVDENNRGLSLEYDFYFFNYHPATMHWLDTRKLKKIKKVMITMVLEVAPGDPFVLCPKNHFHAYCVLDPTIHSDNKTVFSFPRPLEKIELAPTSNYETVPTIGSFGFATKGKGFQHVVEAVNKEFDKAVIRINIPFGDFVPESEKYAKFLGQLCKDKAKEGIEVRVTHNYMSKPELIEWCSNNTLNCFLYDRDMPGLSATTDQAIVSEQPLAVCNNNTFRHILEYIKPYPQQSLKQSIANSQPAVRKMKESWSSEMFCKRFETVLEKIVTQNQTLLVSNTGSSELPLGKKDIYDKFSRYLKKIKNVFKKGGIERIRVFRKFNRDEELI